MQRIDEAHGRSSALFLASLSASEAHFNDPWPHPRQLARAPPSRMKRFPPWQPGKFEAKALLPCAQPPRYKGVALDGEEAQRSVCAGLEPGLQCIWGAAVIDCLIGDPQIAA